MGLDLNLLVGIASVIVGTAVTVVIYRLGRKLDFRARMDLRARLKLEAQSLITTAPSKTELREVIFLNARRYEREWDGGNSFSRHGWLQVRGELLDVKHNGVEVVDEIVRTWLDRENNTTLTRTGCPGPNVMRIGFVPFDRIHYIDARGDEYRGAPNLFVQFGRVSRSPFAHYSYAEVEGVPLREGGRRYFRKIDRLGVTPIGLKHFWAGWGSATLIGEIKRMPRRPFLRRTRPPAAE